MLVINIFYCGEALVESLTGGVALIQISMIWPGLILFGTVSPAISEYG
jgi:hypothetical protein